MQNKYLYSCFDHWFKGGNIWLISDPHFNDPEMKYLRSNYIGDDEQVARINSKVGKNDTIIILGDVGDTEWVKKIRGYKILIMGNHDAGKSNYLRHVDTIQSFDSEEISASDKSKIVEYAREYINALKNDEDPDTDNPIGKCFRIKRIDNKLFDEVYEGPVMISEKVMLSHEPLDLPHCIFNIAGHDHSNCEMQDEFHLNVCAEHLDYYPISLLDLFKKGKFKHVEDVHRQTIDKATERKKRRKRTQR